MTEWYAAMLWKHSLGGDGAFTRHNNNKFLSAILINL
jgi:hypothetical protein